MVARIRSLCVAFVFSSGCDVAIGGNGISFLNGEETPGGIAGTLRIIAAEMCTDAFAANERCGCEGSGVHSARQRSKVAHAGSRSPRML